MKKSVVLMIVLGLTVVAALLLSGCVVPTPPPETVGEAVEEPVAVEEEEEAAEPEPEAEAEHHHRMDFESACRRMITRGKAYDMFIEKTSLQGMASLWLMVGRGPWMTPWLIRPLYRLAVWMQRRAVISLLYITVLMYCFRVGRGGRDGRLGVARFPR